MNTPSSITPTTDTTTRTIPGPALLRSYLLEARIEFLRLLRTPSFSVPSLVFPCLFYLLFGVLLSKGGGDGARYLLATYGTFGIMGAGLFAFGVTVAMERDQGYLRFKRALPMPAGAYLWAKLAMATIFAGAIALLLSVLGATAGKVDLSAGQWALLFLVNLLGVLPFAAIGLWVGTLLGGQAAPAVINILYLPMAFLSGLWVPLKFLPDWIATLAMIWPSYHHAELALKVVGMDSGRPPALHLGVLAAVTLVFFLLARRRLGARG
jgi:ABC-2 type transport system permease protein